MGESIGRGLARRIEAHSGGAAMPGSGGVDERSWLEGINAAPARPTMLDTVFGERGRARVLVGALTGLLGGRVMHGPIGGAAPDVGVPAGEIQTQRPDAAAAGPSLAERADCERDQAMAQASVYGCESLWESADPGSARKIQ